MEAPNKIARILCPVDFTAACRHALELAVALAHRHQAELRVLHVHVPPPPQPELLPTFVPSFEELRPRLLAELRAFVEPLAQGAAYSLEIRSGDPSREIVQSATSPKADLIVIGRHRRRALERWLLGSTAEQVLRRAPCPVLTTGQSPERPAPPAADFARVVCALDLYPSSVRTLEAAASLASATRGELTVLHVVEGPSDETLGVLGHLDVPEYRRQLEAEARRQLHDAVPPEIRAACRVDERVCSGRAYKQILRLADEQAADLIVLGMHGKNPVDTFFFGSTALQVVRAASCPVLTLH